MTATPPPASLRERLIDAIETDALRPHSERLGLVEALLAVVQPELDRAAAAELTIDRMKRTNRMVNGGARQSRERAEHAEAELAARDAEITRLREQLASARNAALTEGAELIRAACLGGGCGDWGRCTCDANADLLAAARTPTS